MKYITLLILLFSISINSQEIQQVEVVKDENNQELGREVSSMRPEAVLRGGFSIGKRF